MGPIRLLLPQKGAILRQVLQGEATAAVEGQHSLDYVDQRVSGGTLLRFLPQGLLLRYNRWNHPRSIQKGGIVIANSSFNVFVRVSRRRYRRFDLR